MGKTGLVAAVLLVGLSVGCGDGNDRPDNISYDGGGGVGAGGGGSGSGGTTCEPIPGQGVELSGDIVIYNSSLIPGQEGHPPFSGQAEIKAEGAPCGWTTTTYDGSAGASQFVLDSVWKSSKFSWVRFTQLETSSEPVYPTMLPVVTAVDLNLLGEFGFVRSTDIDKIYTDTGVTPDPTRATILVQTKDPKFGTPQPGSSVTIGVDAQSAYLVGSTWQLGIGDMQTDMSGLMALMNVQAQEFPGESQTLTTITGSTEQKNLVRIEAGRVTVVWIGIGFSS